MLLKGAFKTDNTNIEYKKKSGEEGGSDLKHELITTTKIKKVTISGVINLSLVGKHCGSLSNCL